MESKTAAAMAHEDLTKIIIGCAFRVFNAMGFGYLESVYENCLSLELKEAGLRVERQHPMTVRYRNQVVGEFCADLIAEETVLVELKSVRGLAQAHEVQLVNYLCATGIEIGLLINFGEKGVEVKRKSRTLPPGTPPSRPSCNPVYSEKQT